MQTQEQAAYHNYNCLRYGPCVTGDASAAGRQRQEYEDTARQASQISSMIASLQSKDAAAEAKLPAIESQLKSDSAAETRLTRSFQAGNSHPGLLTRLRAVVQVSDRGWARVGALALIIVFVIAACGPALLKYRLNRKPSSQYEKSKPRREQALAESRRSGMVRSPRGGDVEAMPAIREAYRLLDEWEARPPATRREVNEIGSRLTSVLVRDWEDRRREW